MRYESSPAMSLGKNPCSMRPGWLQAGSVAVADGWGDTVGGMAVLVAGSGAAVGGAEGVIAGVGGGAMTVGGTAVAANVDVGKTAVVTGSTAQPTKKIKTKKTKGIKPLLPRQFTGFFCHQALVITLPQI